MVIYFTMEISEEKSVNKDCPLKVINLMLQDPAVEASLLSVVAEAVSVLIGDPDEVRSGHRSLQTSHCIILQHYEFPFQSAHIVIIFPPLNKLSLLSALLRLCCLRGTSSSAF